MLKDGKHKINTIVCRNFFIISIVILLLLSGTASAAVSQQDPSTGKILVATNRFVINDDWTTASTAGTGFLKPTTTHNSNSWTAKNTMINATALFIDNTGSPLAGSVITFNLYDPGGAEYTQATINATTNEYGLANFSFDMDARAYYGNWTIKASNSNINQSTGFIYNWWGCGISGCSSGHTSKTPSGSKVINSPYLSGRENPSWSSHNTACTNCHQSFDGRPGGTSTGGTGHTNYVSDVHKFIACDNSNCHQSNSVHGNTGAVIGSCYSAACHTPANRSDISSKTTLNGVVSIYSGKNDSNAAFHTPNSTVPCIICHGPMHNITKPDATQRFTRNINTEASHCMTCHTSYQLHNNSINCTLCHSDDIHVVQIFSRNATYISLNKSSPSSNRGDCTLCHQNSTFLSILKNNSKAGTQTSRTPPQIPNPTHHSDAYDNGSRYGSFWDIGSQDSSCQYCHGKTEHETIALGRISLISGSRQINATFTEGNTSWCLLCHYPGSANYSDMVATFGDNDLNVPPSIIKGSEYYVRGKNHSFNAYNDSLCYTCHNDTGDVFTTISPFMHDVTVGGGGPDCLGCHGIGSTESSLHVNNSVMNSSISYHRTLNENATNSSWVSGENKKCWGCHQSGGTQPENQSMGDRYSMPYTCDECHLIGNEPYENMASAHKVTNHVWVDSSITRIVTHNATCATCHKNSVNLDMANITDSRYISTIESVSHYGNRTSLVDTVSELPAQGCVFCHRNTTNGLTWGGARNIVQSHSETTNTQCYLCHVETVEIPDSFHNSSMFYAGSGKILVASNRYVILDDWIKGSKTDTGFINPGASHSSDSFTGINTKINATALYVNRYGIPIPGAIVSFTLFWPNGTALTTVNDTTNINGLANFSYDLNAKNYYGNWKIQAKNGNIGANTSFIYNWWGCGIGSCESGHSSENPSGSSAKNSPYLNGRDSIVSEEGAHSTKCTNCHQSFDGKPGANARDGVNHLNNASDVHRNITCDNVNCHQTISSHRTNAVIGSCYNANCHKPSGTAGNRSDISSKSTLNGVVSIYSINNGSSFNATFHTPNSTIPCIICHGPMHAITKPDTTLRFQKNVETEYTNCLSCHQDYVRHNRTVSCPVCHSDDIHAIKVFAQNATFITLDHDNPSPYRGNCTNCHQNSTFLSTLLSQPRAGTYTGQNPEIIPITVQHSNDSASGQKWNQTPGYWTNNNQVTSCNYCHTDEVHSTNILGHVSLFKGNNTVNSTISANSSWCSSCHWQGYKNGSSSYSDMSGSFISLNHLVPPEISGHSTYGANQSISGYTNHTSFGKDDSSCFNCHKGNLTVSATITDFMHNVSIGSGGAPNCITCHNLVTGLSGGAPSGINFTAVNSSVHYDINANNATSQGYAAIVGACWACHDSDGNVTSGHPDRYTTPKTCTECHLGSGTYNASSYNAIIVSEHYYSGTDIRTGNSTSDTGSCINCHENASEMILYNQDDDTGSFSGDGIRLNGGNFSYYHYGKNRVDLHPVSNETNCAYCHKANSTFDNVFRNINNNNITHDNGNSCLICHKEKGSTSGRIHDASLLGAGGPDCRSCHDLGTTNVLRHIDFNAAGQGMHGNMNINVNVTNGPCWGCHQTGGTQPSGMGDRAYTPYICTDCHLTGGSASGIFNAPLVSEHYRSGADITAVTAESTDVLSCVKCHQKPDMIVANNDPDNGTYDSDNNGVFGGPTNPYIYGKNRTDLHPVSNETNCSYCHQATSEFNDTFQKLSNTQITHNNGKSCYLCHRESGSVNGRIHDSSLIGGSGGEDCVSCHVPEDVNASKFARHANINSSDGAEIVTNNDCWTCHYQKDMNTSHVYLCDSCHKNSSGVVAISDPALLVGNLKHGSNTCKSCHAPDMYHSGGTAGPKGRVEDPGWQLISPIDSAGCIDCHLNHNGLESPFHGPGIDPNTTSGLPKNHIAASDGQNNGSGCKGSCHNYGVHNVQQGNNNNKKPTLSNPVLYPIIVVNNEPVEVTTRGSAQDQFTSLQIEAAQYRIYNSNGQIIVDWTAMNAKDGRFNSSLETVNATISTTGLSEGTYNVSVRVMASGPKPSTLPEKLLPYYPLNGDWSNPLDATFTIKQSRVINGTVLNTTGSVIPGATITAKNLISGVTYPAVTDNTGFYSLSLSNGTYDLITSKDPKYYINNTIPSVDLESVTTATRDIILTKKPVGTIGGLVRNV